MARKGFPLTEHQPEQEANEIALRALARKLGIQATSNLNTIAARIRELGWPADWTDQAEHGVRARYQAGCRCGDCRAASREYHRALDSRYSSSPGVLPGLRLPGRARP